MKEQFKIWFLVSLTVIGVSIAAEKHTGAVRRAIFNRDFFGGEYNHFLPCSKLPTEVEVQRVLREHRDVIEKFKQLRTVASGPGTLGILGPSVLVSFGNGEKDEKYPVRPPNVGGPYNGISFSAPVPSERCPGKADIYIEFGGISDSVWIKKIIGGDTFFGIPYRMHNM